MPEVEDVPRAPARERQNPLHALTNVVVGCVEHGRIEVALDAFVPTDSLPSLVERDAPVEPDDVPSGLADVFQELTRTDAEVDRRTVEGSERLEDGGAVWLDVAAIVFRAEVPHPTVEYLQHLRARLGLGSQVRDRDGRELAHERGERFRLPVHEALRLDEGARGPAFDQITRQRKGCARETDQRGLRRQLVAHHAERRERGRERLAGFYGAQRGHVAGRPHGVPDGGAHVGDEVQLHTHGHERKQDVSEDDGAVHPEAPNRLQRYLRRQLRLCADVEERVPLPHGSVLRQEAPRLSHEPGRRAVYGLTPARRDKARFGHGHSSPGWSVSAWVATWTGASRSVYGRPAVARSSRTSSENLGRSSDS